MQNAVAFADAAACERVRQAGDRVGKLPVGDRLLGARIVAFPNDGGLVGPRRQVPVDAVVAGIQRCAVEPAHLAFREVVRAHLGPGRVPVEEGLGLLRPERFGIVDGAFVHVLVAGPVDVGVFAEPLRGGIDGHGGPCGLWGFRSSGQIIRRVGCKAMRWTTGRWGRGGRQSKRWRRIRYRLPLRTGLGRQAIE